MGSHLKSMVLFCHAEIRLKSVHFFRFGMKLFYFRLWEKKVDSFHNTIILYFRFSILRNRDHSTSVCVNC